MATQVIQTEIWYREAATFEKLRQQLIEQAQRGLITPEEFMHKMVRLHGQSPSQEEEKGVYLLNRDQWGTLQMTVKWLGAHYDWAEEVRYLLKQLYALRVHGRSQADFSTTFTHSKIWEKVILQSPDRKIKLLPTALSRVENHLSKVYGSLDIHHLFQNPFKNPHEITEADFNNYVREVIQLAKQVLETAHSPEYAQYWNMDAGTNPE